MLVQPHPQTSRARALSAVSSDSSHDMVKPLVKKQHQYFSKAYEPSEDEINQKASIKRLASVREGRRKILNDYELPVSERESWWRTTIRETPGPLKYKISGFIKELNQRQDTFSFKTEGRKRDPMPRMARGAVLLPGAYGYEDFAQRLKKMQRSYCFKDEEVHSMYTDKLTSNPDLGPFSYETENHLAISSNKEPSKASFFKSKNKRNIFIPKEGPSPGEYDETPDKPKHEVSSVFKSRSGRFNSKKEIPTPGPGQYEPISAWIDSNQSQSFNQKGQFFTPSAKVHT